MPLAAADYPAKHLDWLKKGMLMEKLKYCAGTMIFVSHERVFPRGSRRAS
jgi:ATPase subunit of ABC transporter with duplicated ATPase domains